MLSRQARPATEVPKGCKGRWAKDETRRLLPRD